MHRFVFLASLLIVSGCTQSAADSVGLDDDAQGSTALALSDATLVEIPKSDLTLAIWRGHNAFAFKRGTEPFGVARRTDYHLVFRDETHDPLQQRVQGESSLYLVQFFGVAMPEMLAAVGGEAIAPFPMHAYVMRLSSQELTAARAAPFVRAVEPFSGRHRYELPRFAPEAPHRYLVRPTSDRTDERVALMAQLEALGATVHRDTFNHYAIHATMNAAQVVAAAELGFVLHIDAWSEPQPDMDKVRILSGANFLEQSTGFTGTGVRGEVMDGNVNENHSDLKSRPILFHTARSGSNGHGTPTTGIVFGDGTQNPMGRGLLPTGQPIFASYTVLDDQPDSGVPSRRDLTAQLKQAPYEAVFQSNSWGSDLTPQYTNVSAEMDALIFELDFLIFNSMSNYGSTDARPEAWAKNIVSVGGVEHSDTLDVADDRWNGSGSIGPASDGRIKPDLSHFYDMTFAPSGSGGYTQFGGTSGATPITAGHGGLFMQMWSAGLFGNPTPGTTVFANRAHFTTAKAVLVNSATQWNFSGANADLTRVHQGWGRVDVKRLYELRNTMLVVNETDVLTQGQVKRYELTVPAATPEFRATLTWAEPPAVPSAGIHRINDLTLKVTAPDGTVYFGNVGLDANMFSKSGGVANTKDILENVFVQNPAAGTWVVEVRADEIAKDNHLETAAVDVDYALVVSGITRAGTQVPTVVINAPANNATVSGVVNVLASAASTITEPDAVAKVRFGLPDGTFVDDTMAPYDTTFDTTRVANGPAQFTAVAHDRSGTTSALATVNVTVSNATNQRPTVALLQPATALSGVVSFSATANDADGTVAKVRFTLPSGATVEDTTSPYSATFDTRSVADGTYTVSAIATDNAGLESLPSAVTVVVKQASTCADGRTVATGLPKSIPDNNPTGIEVPFTVSGPGTVQSVALSLDIRHTYRGDLIVQLVSPSGTAKDIARRVGGAADNLTLTNAVVAGFTGAAAGTWKLKVVDAARADVGTVDSASLLLDTDCTP